MDDFEGSLADPDDRARLIRWLQTGRERTGLSTVAVRSVPFDDPNRFRATGRELHLSPLASLDLLVNGPEPEVVYGRPFYLYDGVN